mgnify:CR=1 FL=1
MSLLSLRNVSKFYYSKGIVTSGFSRLSLDLDRGEFVVITGESGSGKSTLLNVISGLDTYEEGELYINGEETNAFTPKELEEYRKTYIANVFQSFNLIASYTVYQNVALILQINGVKYRDIRPKVEQALRKVGLWEIRHQKASRLSGGQKQRLAIVRAMAMEPDVMLFDEPTSALDPMMVGEVLNLIKDLADSGMTMVVVTHEMGFAREVADRVMLFHNGLVEEDCPPDQFFEDNQNPQVKEFLSHLI